MPVEAKHAQHIPQTIGETEEVIFDVDSTGGSPCQTFGISIATGTVYINVDGLHPPGQWCILAKGTSEENQAAGFALGYRGIRKVTVKAPVGETASIVWAVVAA